MKYLALTLIWLFASMSTAHAQLNVSKTTLELSESDPRSMVRISNSGADTLYVNLDIEQLLDPANDESLRKPIDLLNNPKILVLPQQLALEPGQTKLVRVVSTNTDIKSDKVFRLNVVPFAGKPLSSQKEQKSIGVKILMGYKLLVLVRPEKILSNIEYQQSSSTLTFSNTGNTSVLLRQIEACNTAQNVCEDLAANRLYPGETHKVTLPQQLQSKPVSVKTRQSIKYTENIVEY